MPSIEDLLLDVEHEADITAPAAAVFEAMIHELAGGHTGPDGTLLQLELERKPGGRWYRNLEDGSGHLWGFVQSIREPDLLELSGPMFMSYPVSNHIIIRFEETEKGTLLRFRHRALGLIDPEHREGIKSGWHRILEKVNVRAAA